MSQSECIMPAAADQDIRALEKMLMSVRAQTKTEPKRPQDQIKTDVAPISALNLGIEGASEDTPKRQKPLETQRSRLQD